MARPRKPLAKRYGKLEVLVDTEGSKARVRCDCGETKWVLRTNLLAGRISSCGGPNCRTHRAPASNPLDRIKGPDWIPFDAIDDLLAKRADRVSVPDLAELYGVHPQTVYALFRAVKQAGGVATYVARVQAAKAAKESTPDEPEVEAPRAPSLPIPGVMPEPPEPLWHR